MVSTRRAARKIFLKAVQCRQLAVSPWGVPLSGVKAGGRLFDPGRVSALAGRVCEAGRPMCMREWCSNRYGASGFDVDHFVCSCVGHAQRGKGEFDDVVADGVEGVYKVEGADVDGGSRFCCFFDRVGELELCCTCFILLR